jgi:cytochrome c oxidase subunit 4
MSHDAKAAGHAEHHHPTGNQYLKIAILLTAITVVEVWAYYIPSLVASPLFNPALLIMSAVKFAIVVLFYMHLKFDNRLFRIVFTGSLIVAMATITALLFLFGKLSL